MELNLISCNIRFDNPADGNNSWSHRRSLLTKTLLSHSPHIIATQEGRIHQLNDFCELLSNFNLIDQHRSWIKERMYPSFFIKKNTFEILGSGDYWLSETPDVAGSISFESAFPRLMTWIKLQPKGIDKKLLLVNTHFDHIKEETRVAQMRVLIQQIKKIHSPEFTLVIMGDFNDSPTSQIRMSLMNEFNSLEDSWLKHNTIEETSHHAFMGEIQNGSRIDWILIEKDLSIQNCFMDKSHQNGHYPSDHFPIICNVKL